MKIITSNDIKSIKLNSNDYQQLSTGNDVYVNIKGNRYKISIIDVSRLKLENKTESSFKLTSLHKMIKARICDLFNFFTAKQLKKRLQKEYIQWCKEQSHTDIEEPTTNIEEAINILKDDNSNTNKKLRNLFDSSFFDKKQKPTKEQVSEFLVNYKIAIQNEEKNSKRDYCIKEKRVEAINKLIHAAHEIEPNDELLGHKLQAITDMAGTVRESHLVKQDMPYCGYYAALQAAWNHAPEKMVGKGLTLLNKLDEESGLMNSENFNLWAVEKFYSYENERDMHYRFIDNLMIWHFSLFREKKYQKIWGSYAYHNKVIYDELDIPYLMIDIKKFDQIELLKKMEALCKKGNNIIVAINGLFIDWMENKGSYIKKSRFQKEKAFLKYNGGAYRDYHNNDSHAFGIENFSFDENKKIVNFKIYTWGGKTNVEMSFDEFQKTFHPYSGCFSDKILITNL